LRADVGEHGRRQQRGDVVAAVLAENGVATSLTRLAVTERPGSGPPDALLAAAGIDCASIVAAAEKVLQPSAA